MAEEYILARPAPITIPAEDADRLLALGNGDAALLYLWLLKNGGRFDREKAEREENARQRGEFLGQYRWLSGQAKEMSAQAAKRPETKCREFKAFLLNGILVRLRDTLEADMEVSLPLVSEQEEHSYSDVSLLLRSYMDLCAGYAEKHYNLQFDFQGRQLLPGRYGYGRRY